MDSGDEKQEAEEEDGSDLRQLDVLPDDKISDVMRQIPSGGDMYVTGGRVLRGSGKLRSCGASDGCTIQVMSRMRGGGRHKDKGGKAEKKQAASPKRSEPLQVKESGE